MGISRRLSAQFVPVLLFWLGLNGSAFGDEATTTSTARYDPELAERLGADDYGMRSYFLVILVSGPADVTDEEQRKAAFAGHFANMGQMAEAGQLVLAGPLMDDPPKRGLFVLNAASREEAEALVQSDPAVKAGIFGYEIAKWYGSAGVMMMNEIHQRVQAKAIE